MSNGRSSPSYNAPKFFGVHFAQDVIEFEKVKEIRAVSAAVYGKDIQSTIKALVFHDSELKEIEKFDPGSVNKFAKTVRLEEGQ